MRVFAVRAEVAVTLHVERTGQLSRSSLSGQPFVEIETSGAKFTVAHGVVSANFLLVLDFLSSNNLVKNGPLRWLELVLRRVLRKLCF